MKLFWRIGLSISVLMTVILTIWGLSFYRAIIDEVNDEIDDALELYSEELISRVLRNEELPATDNGTNNYFFLEKISEEQAASRKHIEYSNIDVYIKKKKETEPARVLCTIFLDDKGTYNLLTVCTPTIDSGDLIDAITFWIVILFSLCLISIITICAIVIWRSTRPLRNLLSWINNNDIKTKPEPLNNPTNIIEYKSLNRAIEDFAIHSNRIYNRQKEFISNASHEIQTPVAICRSRLDLLLNTSLNEEQMKEIVKIQQTLTHMSKLNKELLLLSKIDNGQFSSFCEIDITNIIRQTLEDLEQIYAKLNIKTEVVLNHKIILNADITLITIMISNIIKNAFAHNIPNGSITINLSNNTLFVYNTGNNIVLSNDKVFNRFYQGQRKEGSTGLGLAIVKAISDMYGFHIGYKFENNNHLFFIIFSQDGKNVNK